MCKTMHIISMYLTFRIIDVKKCILLCQNTRNSFGSFFTNCYPYNWRSMASPGQMNAFLCLTELRRPNLTLIKIKPSVPLLHLELASWTLFFRRSFLPGLIRVAWSHSWQSRCSGRGYRLRTWGSGLCFPQASCPLYVPAPAYTCLHIELN